MRRTAIAFPVLAAALLAAACGPPRVKLPTGTGTPTSDYGAAFGQATMRCHDVRTLTAELALSGSISGQKIRGRALVGFAPGMLRLEALAPGGSPAFILVANAPRGTLLLSREGRVVEGAAAEILDALVRVKLGPDDLRALLSGCVKASMEVGSARRYGTEWLAIDIAGGGTAYLRRGRDGAWRFIAASYGGLDVQYGELTSTAVPDRVMIRSMRVLDLNVALQQVEVNGNLDRASLTTLVIPPGSSPMTLEELRRTGPFAR
jgi:hypothetical protein